MASGASQDEPVPQAPLPGLGYEDRPGESDDERPPAAAFVRAKARVARTTAPKGPSFEKVAGRSPGAAPFQESSRLPSTSSLPEVNASREHMGSVLDPLVARRGARDVFLKVADSAVRPLDRARAALRGHRLFIVTVLVLVLGIALLVVRVRRGDPSGTPAVTPSGG